MSKKINIYAVGICYASVCAHESVSIEKIGEALNAQYPTGAESRWIHCAEKFKDGSDNPHNCEKSEDYKHYLFNC